MKSFDEIFEFSSKADGNGTQDHLLCTATADELKAFIPHVMSLPHGSRVVEVGTYSGRSTSVYFQVQKDLDLDIHLVDCWNWNPEYAAQTFTGMVIAHFNDIPFTYHKMVSEQLIPTWTLPIDFLYLDGAHDAPQVDYDFENWIKFVRSGGILAAHDITYPGVLPCLDRFIRGNNWELLAEAGEHERWGNRMTIWKKP